jgi:WD40 repeat protein
VSFDGFISYSHAADGRLAPAVQRGLHRLAKPWHRRRALWIFRDQTGLAVTPHLWTSIQKALDNSDYFLLLASPEAAKSPWVNREIEHWVATKSLDRILPVVTDGEWEWDAKAKDFAASCTAVPPALRGVFAEEPLYLDLRWARNDQQLSLRHSRFRDSIAQLAAPMHGVSKDDLEGEDVRQHRRAGRLRLAALTSLVVLATLASATGMAAVHNAAQARASTVEAHKQQQEASTQRGSAAKYADEATKQKNTAQQQTTRAQLAKADAARQEAAAKVQRGLAAKASGEVKKQLANADRAAARARQQQKLAQRQTVLANEAAQEMVRQQARAKEQEGIAKQQQKLAGEAGAEATRQKQIAAEQQRLAAAAGAEARKQAQIAKEQQEAAKKASEEAARQEKISISRRLVNEAKVTMEDDPQTALKLGIAAQKVYPETEIRREAAGLVTSTRYAGSIADAALTVAGPGALTVTVNSDQTVSMWDTTNRSDPRRLSTIGEPGPLNTGLALSRDGRTLVVISDNVATLWDVAKPGKPALLTTLPDRPRDYASATFSPDGKTLVTGDRGEDNAYASLWDLTDRSHPGELSKLTGTGRWFSGSDFKFSEDGHTLVASHNQTDIWDITNLLKPVRRSAITDNQFQYAVSALSPTLPLLAMGDYAGKVAFFDLSDLDKPAEILSATGNGEGIASLAFSANGRLLASGDTLGTTVVREINGMPSNFGEPPREVARVSVHSSIRKVGFSSDAATLVTTDFGEKAVFWNVAEFAAPQRVADVPWKNGTLRALSYAPDGKSMVTVGGDGTAVFWDVTEQGEVIQRHTVDANRGMDVGVAAVTDDHSMMVAARSTGPLTVTDVSDPANPQILGTMSLSSVSTLAFSPSGKTLLIGEGNKLRLYDLSNRHRPAPITELSFPASNSNPFVGTVSFSPDGHTMTVISGRKVTVWNFVDGAKPTPASTLVGHGSGVRTATFSPDGKTVATASSDRTVILWDVTDRAKPHRLATLTGNGNEVELAAFSLDGKTLATGSPMDSAAQVWDIAQLNRPIRLAKIQLDPSHHASGMTFLADPNKLMIITDYTWQETDIDSWDVQQLNALRADPTKLSCSIAGGGLTDEEWERYIPELSYQRTCTG